MVEEIEEEEAEIAEPQTPITPIITRLQTKLKLDPNLIKRDPKLPQMSQIMPALSTGRRAEMQLTVLTL